MTVFDVLREARALCAANPSHAPVEPDEGTVCVIWAISDAAGGMNGDHWANAEKTFRKAAGSPIGLVGWNAEHTTAEVLAVFDRAIASLAPDGTDAG